MAKNIRGDSAEEIRELERHTGADGILKFEVNDPVSSDDGAVYRVPITNVQWTRDYTTEEIQHNGTLAPTLSTSEIRYSGSFEYDGQNPGIMDLVRHEKSGAVIERDRPVRGNITIKEYSHQDGNTVVQTITFLRCLITSNDRDMSVGDVSNTTFDFEAEEFTYTSGASSNAGN